MGLWRFLILLFNGVFANPLQEDEDENGQDKVKGKSKPLRKSSSSEDSEQEDSEDASKGATNLMEPSYLVNAGYAHDQTTKGNYRGYRDPSVPTSIQEQQQLNYTGRPPESYNYQNRHDGHINRTSYRSSVSCDQVPSLHEYETTKQHDPCKQPHPIEKHPPNPKHGSGCIEKPKKHVTEERHVDNVKASEQREIEDLVRTLVQQKFPKHVIPQMKFFDAAVLYDKYDYDEANVFKEEVAKMVRNTLHEDLRIDLFDREAFSDSQVLVVEDVVNRCSIVLVYLTENCNSPNFRFFLEEAVGMSRLTINKPGKQWILKPVHTDPPQSRRYRTPVGLLTTKGIEWYDRTSPHTTDRIIQMMYNAIKERKTRENSCYISDQVPQGIEDGREKTKLGTFMEAPDGLNGGMEKPNVHSWPMQSSQQQSPYSYPHTINETAPMWRSQYRDTFVPTGTLHHRDQPHSYPIQNQLASNQGYYHLPQENYSAPVPGMYQYPNTPYVPHANSGVLYQSEFGGQCTPGYGHFPNGQPMPNARNSGTWFRNTTTREGFRDTLQQQNLNTPMYGPLSTGNQVHAFQQQMVYPTSHQSHDVHFSMQHVQRQQPGQTNQSNEFIGHMQHYNQQSRPQHSSRLEGHPTSEFFSFQNSGDPATPEALSHHQNMIHPMPCGETHFTPSHATGSTDAGRSTRQTPLDDQHDTPLQSELRVVSKVTGKLILNPNLSTDDVEIDTREVAPFSDKHAKVNGQRLPKKDRGSRRGRKSSKHRQRRRRSSDVTFEESSSDDGDFPLQPLMKGIKSRGGVVNIIGNEILQIGNKNTVTKHKQSVIHGEENMDVPEKEQTLSSTKQPPDGKVHSADSIRTESRDRDDQTDARPFIIDSSNLNSGSLPKLVTKKDVINLNAECPNKNFEEPADHSSSSDNNFSLEHKNDFDTTSSSCDSKHEIVRVNIPVNSFEWSKIIDKKDCHMDDGVDVGALSDTELFGDGTNTSAKDICIHSLTSSCERSVTAVTRMINIENSVSMETEID